MARIWKNVGRGTLNATVNSSDTTWIVDDPNLTLPVLASGESCDLACGTEYVLASGPSSGTTTKTYTVARQQDGSTAAAHTAGAQVVHPITAGALGAFTQEGSATYEVAFTAQTTVTILNSAHGFGHPRLQVHVYDTASPMVEIAPATVTVSRLTYTVIVTFSGSTSGYINISG